ncbi:AAA family ATPase [Luteibacter sp. HA06]|jgi:predicted ATPase
MSSLDAEHYLLDVRLRRERISSFETYPFSLPAVKELGTLKLHPKVTFIVGENGSGKSTLLEAIATNWGFNRWGRASGGRRMGSFFELKASSMWLPRLKSSTLNPRRRHLSSIPTVIDRFTSSRTVSRSLR